MSQMSLKIGTRSLSSSFAGLEPSRFMRTSTLSGRRPRWDSHQTRLDRVLSSVIMQRAVLDVHLACAVIGPRAPGPLSWQPVASQGSSAATLTTAAFCFLSRIPHPQRLPSGSSSSTQIRARFAGSPRTTPPSSIGFSSSVPSRCCYHGRSPQRRRRVLFCPLQTVALLGGGKGGYRVSRHSWVTPSTA